jgi:hypothetical protein
VSGALRDVPISLATAVLVSSMLLTMASVTGTPFALTDHESTDGKSWLIGFGLAEIAQERVGGAVTVSGTEHIPLPAGTMEESFH